VRSSAIGALTLSWQGQRNPAMFGLIIEDHYRIGVGPLELCVLRAVLLADH